MFAAVAASPPSSPSSRASATGDRRGRTRRRLPVRAIGDAGPHWLSWLSPLGWMQQLRPFADERWWVLLLAVALIVPLR
jgi:ABC-2 type transport system permease protein